MDIVLKNSLDRETKGEHSLNIVLRWDGGNPPKSGTVVIEVRVLDMNENAPVFSQPMYNTRLSENAAPRNVCSSNCCEPMWMRAQMDK